MRPYKNPLTDSKEACKITIRQGKLFLVDHENFILLTSPIILKNGIIITMEGFMKMPDGTTRKLMEGEYV
jgi:hypothetical protein